MKKRSLLSLLALAGILLLGCQNYDQFDALGKEIDDLKEQFEQVTTPIGIPLRMPLCKKLLASPPKKICLLYL